MSFDITDSLAPTSDQLDAVDLLGGPRTFVIESVAKGNAEQPVQVHLKDFPRPWRPGKSMRRVLAAGWGTDAAVWVGRSVRLYCDTDVVFGGVSVGGTRIESMSHLKETLKVPLLIKRGKSAVYTVQPLAESAPTKAELNVAECDSIPDLREAWKYADPAQKKRIEARVKELEKRAFEDDARADMRDEAEAQDALDKVLGVGE